MLSKKDRPFFFTDQQMEQLKSTNGTLLRLNRDVRRELRRIGRSNISDKKYRVAGLLLGNLAMRMISVVQLREDVLDSGRAQEPAGVDLVIDVVCIDCVISGKDRQETSRNSDQVPEADPAHLPELESLIETAQKIGDQAWSRPRILPNACITGLKRLTNALRKQRRHLHDIAPAPPSMKVELILKFETCSVCHKPMEDSIKSNDPSALISSGNDLKN